MGPLRIGSLFGRFAKKDKVESSQFNLSLVGKWPNDFTSEAKKIESSPWKNRYNGFTPNQSLDINSSN